MTATACTLAAVLLFEAATAPATTEECPIADNRCNAKLYERRAMTAANANHRALYLFTASKSYQILFDKSGDVRDLCAARRVLDASLAVPGQSQGMRTQSQTMLDTLIAREQQEHARCSSGTKPRGAKPADPPLVARRPTAESPTEPPASLMPRPVATPTPPTSLASSDAETTAVAHSPRPTELRLLVDADPSSLPVTQPPQDAGLMPVPSGREHLGRSASTPRPGRGLVIAGGVTLGVGVALTAAAGAMGHRLRNTQQALITLSNSVDGYATPDQDARDTALRRDYQAMMPATIALALSGGATVILAVILTSVGGRRMARAASRVALIPAPRGLVFHARF